MIETEELLQDLNLILSLNYIDSCFLGPYDLSNLSLSNQLMIYINLYLK